MFHPTEREQKLHQSKPSEVTNLALQVTFSPNPSTSPSPRPVPGEPTARLGRGQRLNGPRGQKDVAGGWGGEKEAEDVKNRRCGRSELETSADSLGPERVWLP